MFSDPYLRTVQVRQSSVTDADVEFVGYSIPHPTQPFMYLRLQTYDRPAADVLYEALTTLEEMCDTMEAKYDKALAEFQTA